MIREFADFDAEPAAALLAAQSPWLWTAGGIRHALLALPERARRRTWVAASDGELVGWGEAEFGWLAERDDIGTVRVLVAPDRRRRGVGSALFDRAVAHMLEHGARELRTWSLSDGDSFLEQRGFRRARVERVSAVDPRTIDTSALDELPAGVALVPLGELSDRLPEVHELYAGAVADMPADHPETNLPYDEWLKDFDSPERSWEGSFVVLLDDRPVSVSSISVDGERGVAEHGLTGTSRSFRRRGFARLAKLAALRWCAQAGFVRVVTGNDASNAAMLGLNDQLGFRPFAIETEWVKQVA